MDDFTYYRRTKNVNIQKATIVLGQAGETDEDMSYRAEGLVWVNISKGMRALFLYKG
jgi:hypothetical protein